MTDIILPYVPRAALRPFHARTARYAHLVCHRRSGKTTGVLADTVARAMEGPPDGRYAYIAPYYGQAKAIAWDILRGLARNVTKAKSEVELHVTLINGARVRLFGADRPDALRGLKLHGVACDEYADWSPSVYEEVLRPMLADTGGWAVFPGTPKGRNHFHEGHEFSRRGATQEYTYDGTSYAWQGADWFGMLLPASVSGLIAPHELEAARNQMSPEVYAQEFECSFVAPRSGSYYGERMEQARAEGRVGHFPHDPEQPVHAAGDLGYTDSTAFWFWQERPNGYALIDYEEHSGRALDWWVALLKAKGYRYERVWLPHDARAKSLQTGRSTVEQMLSSDLPVAIGPELRVQHGIDAVRMQMPMWHFHEDTTAEGMKRLSNYRRKWNSATNSYAIQPLHDESSHGADAARGMALVQRQTPDKPLDIRPITTGHDRTFQLNVLFEDRESATGQGVEGMGT